MEMQVAQWGNSLALRIPAEIARRVGFRGGDTVTALITLDGALTIRPAHWNRGAFAAELQQAHTTQPVGESVVDAMRADARF